MTAAFPPHHIKSVAIDCNGWVVPSSQANGTWSPDEIPITKSCRLLLAELKLDLSHSMFQTQTAADNVDTSQSTVNKEAPIPLQDLPQSQGISQLIVRTILTVRKMGDTNNNDTPSVKKKHRKDGKIARLEEQRRMRKQKELDDHESNEGFAPVGEAEKVKHNISLNARFCMAFNSLRAMVTILRPVLNHPQKQDFELKMKNGTSIQKGERKNKKPVFYLFFDYVYDAVKLGGMRELIRELSRMLEDLGINYNTVMRQNKDGTYEFGIVDCIQDLVEQGQCCMNGEAMANLCFEQMPKNPDVESKLHDALMKRFDFSNDEKQLALKKSISNLQEKLTEAISYKMSRNSRLTVYGSCLSGLTLEGSHDVDISVYIPELYDLKEQFDNGKLSASQYDARMSKQIFRVKNALIDHKKYGDSFVDVFAITKARVPVIKGVDRHSNNPYSDSGHLHFDLCFLNDIAVVNSSLLREYSLLDKRVRVLMLCVKGFAKKNGISSAADSTFSSYSWNNLMVFYLQCIGFLPVLQCPKLMEEHNFKPDLVGNSWHSVNSLKTYYLSSNDILQSDKWRQPSRFVNTSLPELLYGFFSFYSDIFPQETVAASIRVGSCTAHKASFQNSSRLWRMAVEDPFETFDSHCPHDLGSHLNENGQKKIMNCLRAGLRDLTKVLESRTNDATTEKKLFDLIGCDNSKLQQHQKDFIKKNGHQNGNIRKPNKKKHKHDQNRDEENIQMSNDSQRKGRNNKKSNGRMSPSRPKSDFVWKSKGGNNSQEQHNQNNHLSKKNQNTTLNATQQISGHSKTSKQSRQQKPFKNGKPRHHAKNHRNHNGSGDVKEDNTVTNESSGNRQRETVKEPKHDISHNETSSNHL